MGSSAPLQFDQAEVEGGPTGRVHCSACSADVGAQYYEVAGQPVCGACRARLQPETLQGGGFLRFLRACLFGMGVAALGTAVYGTIIAVFNYELALITIPIGIGVGKAVRAGGREVGGWPYQILAVLLTYCSLCFSYVPAMFRSTWNERPLDERGVFMFLVMLVVLAVFSFGAPFMNGLGSILSVLIIGFGLRESWKINRVSAVEVRGPFDAVAAPPVPVISLAK